MGNIFFKSFILPVIFNVPAGCFKMASKFMQFDPEEEGVLSDEEIEKLEDYFEKVEKDWGDRMERLFVQELGLSRDDLMEYHKMRAGFEQDKLAAFEEFHEQMLEKHGEKYTYSPSREEEEFEKQIREKYSQALRKRIGEDRFERWSQEREAFNEQLARDADSQMGRIRIEF